MTTSNEYLEMARKQDEEYEEMNKLAKAARARGDKTSEAQYDRMANRAASAARADRDLAKG